MPSYGLIESALVCFFMGYFSRVTLKFFARLVSGSPEDL